MTVDRQEDGFRLDRRKMEALATMARSITHDFNNYLTAIHGNATLIANNQPEGSPAAWNVGQILSTSNSATVLIRELLFFTGYAKCRRTDIQLPDFVSEALDTLRVELHGGISLETRIDAPPPSIAADKEQLHHVLKALILNADEAMADTEDGTIRITCGSATCNREFLDAAISLADRPEEALYAYLEVSDTGRGIQPDVRERMFDPFFSTKIRGRGLGLSTTLGILKAHHGVLTLSTEIGKGTRVRIYLPENKQ